MTLTYSAVRSRIRSGDIIGTSHNSYRSWYDLQVMAVRHAMGDKIVHVGLAWVIGERVFIIEAVVPKVRIVPLSHVAAEGFWWAEMNREFTANELNFALARVGVADYSKWQAVLAGLGLLKVGADRATECAEFVIECARQSGYELGPHAVPGRVLDAAQENYAAPVWKVKGE